MLKAPTKAEFTFTGWYSEVGLTNEVTTISGTDDVTLYAGWEAA